MKPLTGKHSLKNAKNHAGCYLHYFSFDSFDNDNLNNHFFAIISFTCFMGTRYYAASSSFLL